MHPEAREGEDSKQGGPSAVESYLRTSFLRRVAHEIRGPAGVLTGALDELQLVIASGGDPTVLVTMARRGIARLLRVADLLSMTAELEGAPIEPEFSTVDVAEFVRSCVEKTVGVVGRRSVSVDVEASASPSVKVDVRFLGPALSELFANAIRFARSKVRIRVVETPEVAMIIVEDDGPGMNSPLPPARFEDRGHSGGLALSLPMVVQVVATHGGSTAFGVSTLPPGNKGATGLSVSVALPKRPAS